MQKNSKSIKDRYRNEVSDQIFCYFMRTVLHMQNSGIASLPLEHDFEEPLKSFLDLALELFIDGQPPETAELILGAEYDAMISSGQVCAATALNLRLIKELSCHIHYDADAYGYLLDTVNLWGNEVFAYASRTFYPNFPEEMKKKYHIHKLLKYMRKEEFRLDDY